jgi:tRNA pseudouridine38-40 synthase
MRIVLGIEYVGTAFSGWQIQRRERSVQGTLENALACVANHPVQVTCAGRTDAGVHAVGQVIHFDTDADRPEKAWTMGVNSNLPGDVSVCWARRVEEAFHARFSARSRTYRYVIHNAPLRSALLADRAWWLHRELNVERMQAAAGHLLGEHDFSAFRAAECQAKSPVRRLESAVVTRSGHLVWLQVTANAFLHHMVRNIAGTLVRVGTGEADPGWLAEVLGQGDRARAGMTAPAGGLYFLSVDYGILLKVPEPLGGTIPGGAARTGPIAL